MAEQAINRRLSAAGGVIALAVAVLVLLMHSPFSALEESVTSLKYTIRGAGDADTNIVIVYIDDEAIKTLGWPVHRNFYALMVKALTDLRVKSIGIESLFEDERPEYAEYDDLLSSVIGSARNVVLSSYFRSTAEGAPPPDTGGVLPLFAYPHVRDVALYGSGFHAPLTKLTNGAAGVGHVNFTGSADVPVFIGSGNRVVPSFAAEILREYLSADRNGVKSEGDRVTVTGSGGTVSFRVSPGGIARLNFPGRLSSFVAYPFVEVLKSYDAAKGDRQPLIPVYSLRDKIVLLGIIAEGRGEFRATPVDPRYPSVALQAVFLDNALHSRFLMSTPRWLEAILVLVAAGACAAMILFVSSPRNTMITAGALTLVLILSYMLFSATSFNLPVVSLIIAGAASGIVALLYKHRLVREQIHGLQTEKDAVTEQLRDKEAKLALLERELLNLEAARTADRTTELMEEIRRYKADIRLLSSKADDLVEYVPEIRGAGTFMAEFEGLVFERNGKMKPVIEFVSKIAPSDAPVLILGESGTGKELVARAIHKRSTRSEKPCIAVNCGALAENLLESELFGHERGAFTGAVKDKSGRFELADGGTIFLDEIGEVSEGFQLKLLRVLQEGELERVGGTKTLKVNVRVVAATNKDLKEEVQLHRFREDLYYRLNVLTVAIPPVRERTEDIPILVDHFLKREGGTMRISKNVMDVLQSYPWPGNVRELESTIKRSVLLAGAEKRTMITVKDLTEEIMAAAENAVAVQIQILESLREKGFSRSSISETGDELGGLNRGTVAEYLRGECLKSFSEHLFDLEQTVLHISLSTDRDVNDRVRKKLLDYLGNISEAISKDQPWESARKGLKPKLKNLPQRYHPYLEQVAEAYYRGVWNFEEAE